jgi:hypothetical protein
MLRQPKTCANSPPMELPSMSPADTATAMTESARPRRPGSNAAATMAGPFAMSIAAPTPCAARAAISEPTVGAAPQRSEPTTKTARPAT